jgi:uncharacterized protein (TIGR03437 family)
MGFPKLLAFISILTFSALAADSTVTIVSAASPKAGITPDSLASIFGPNLSTQKQAASGPPWPTALGDMPSVTITDATGTQRSAQILFISPEQMNVYLPPSMAHGPAVVSFPTTGLPPGAGTAALRNVPVTIQAVAPALFSADGSGSGPAAATAVRIAIPTTVQFPVPVVECGLTDSCQAVPIDPGLDAPVYLSFYGTGIRGGSKVTVKMGSLELPATYAGPQPQTPGLDQINVPLSFGLRGAGLIDVIVTVDGVASNAVQVNIR